MYKDRLDTLFEAMSKNESKEEKADDFDFVEEKCAYILEYPAIVAFSEIRIRMATARYMGEPEKYQEAMKNIDNQRVSAHQRAIMSINQLNRLCKAYEVEACFPENRYGEYKYERTDDRYRVAEICDIFINEFKATAKDREEEIKIAKENVKEIFAEAKQEYNIEER